MGEHPTGAWGDDNGLRWYTFQDEDYLSVTSMRKALGMPYNLHRWVLKNTLEAVQKNPDLLTREPGMTEANVRGRIMRAGESSRDIAAERGTEVHKVISEGWSMKDIPEELHPYVASYAQAVIALGIRPIMTERQVYNREYMYAGSFDLLAYVRLHDEVTVIDLKTGKGTYPEHALQGKSYFEAEFVATTDGKDIDEEATHRLASASGIGILRLGPTDWEYKRIRNDDALTEGWRAHAQLARWFTTHKTIDSLTY